MTQFIIGMPESYSSDCLYARAVGILLCHSGYVKNDERSTEILYIYANVTRTNGRICMRFKFQKQSTDSIQTSGDTIYITDYWLHATSQTQHIGLRMSQ